MFDLSSNIKYKNNKLIVLATSILITACGGSSNESVLPITTNPNAPVVVASPTVQPTIVPPVVDNSSITPPTVTPVVDNADNPPIIPPIVPPVVSPPISGNVLSTSSLLSNQPITTLTIDSTGAVNQKDIPITFGQIFSVGDLQVGTSLSGRLDNGTLIPLQVEVKATHADSSVRHAIISAVLPSLAVNQSVKLELLKSTYIPTAPILTPQEVVNKGFKAGVSITIGGIVYTANAQDAINNGKKWLSGALANEWVFSTPLKTSSGIAHPHLQARFSVRTFNDINKTKVDFSIENDWAFEPNPQNFIYDVKLTVGTNEVYAKNGLTHYQHARWRKVFWSSDTPAINIRHETKYLIASKAVPNYDPTVKITSNALNWVKTAYSGAAIEPMGNGLATPYMPMTGGRPDIGLLPGWAVTYLLSMDKDAKTATLGTGDMAGSWSMHFRDKNTDKPVDLFDYPYMTVVGRTGDTYNPVTKKLEAFPDCASGADCSNPNTTDGAHEPEFVYLPYLVTGDYYYLEELEFWAMFNSFSSNPGYRGNILGLVTPEQTRGQAWNLRNIAHAAYILPDSDVLKTHLTTILNNNLDWYNKTYTQNPTGDNTIGAILNGESVVYDNGTGLAGWQDDFFTSAIGHIDELGFVKAKALLAWKARFPVSRMTDPGTCWILATNYYYTVKASPTSPLYTNWSDIYKASVDSTVSATACGSAEMTKALKLLPAYAYIVDNEMVGYSNAVDGYPSNMQPALAYSANTGINNAAKAWSVFINRSVKPNYGDSAQFAIVPR